MIYKQIPWPSVFTFIPQETLLQGVARQHLAHFQKGLFKTKFLDNKRSIESIYHNKKYISSAKLPACYMGYEVDDNPQNTLMNSNFPYQSGAHWLGGPLNTFYWRIFAHPRYKVSLHANFIRKRYTINIRYLFADRYQQDDFYNYLINTFPYGGPGIKFNTDSTIYAAIPNNMIEYLAVVQGYDLTNPITYRHFMRELEEYSYGLIRRKKIMLQDEVSMCFLGYKNPLMKIWQPDRPEKDDGEQIGQIKTRFGITENVVFEPHIPTMFITKAPEVINGRKLPNEFKPQVFGSYDIDPRHYITRNVDLDPPPRYKMTTNMVVIATEEFSVSEEMHNKPESIPIDGDLISADHLKVIDIIKRRAPLNGDPSYVYTTLSQAYQIILQAYGTQLKLHKDFTVDWETMQITILKAQANVLYRLRVLRDTAMTGAYLQNIHVHDDPDAEPEINFDAKVGVNEP